MEPLFLFWGNLPSETQSLSPGQPTWGCCAKVMSIQVVGCPDSAWDLSPPQL